MRFCNQSHVYNYIQTLYSKYSNLPTEVKVYQGLHPSLGNVDNLSLPAVLTLTNFTTQAELQQMLAEDCNTIHQQGVTKLVINTRSWCQAVNVLFLQTPFTQSKLTP